MVDLSSIHELQKAGQHEEARQQLIQLATQFPNDAAVHYETACVHDFLGFEHQAVPFYLAAIRNGLSGSDLRGAYLGLGSTYRTLGQYEESKRTFLEGLLLFPEATEIKVFLAMTLYNLGDFHASVGSLLRVIVNTTSDSATKSYERAIRLYAEDLDRHWD